MTKLDTVLNFLEVVEEEAKYIADLAMSTTKDNFLKTSKKIYQLSKRLEKEVEDIVSGTYEEIHNTTKK